MHFLLIPVGSYGDVHPYVGLGRMLKSRGHEVTLMSSAYFEHLARAAELDFVPLGTRDDYLNTIQNPDLWHPTRGLDVVVRLISTQIENIFHLVKERYRPGETVVVAAGMAFGARIAHEKLGVPLATIHLQPSCFISEYETAILPGAAFASRLPRWAKRWLFAIGDWRINRLCGRSINEFRKTQGMQPVRRVMYEWWHSPQCVVGMFPEWFGSPQPDWPDKTHLTNFPLYDEADIAELDPSLQAFLEEGDRPIVFTPGSGNRFGHSFFRAAVEACQQLKRRGILLSRYPEHVPQALPPSVRHFEFVPFSKVLGGSSALVHHGGIGTVSQAMFHAVPQIIMPLSHDQPDNAAKVRRLGVGDSLVPKSFTGDRLATKLARLLDSPEVRDKCEILSNKLKAGDGLTKTANIVESFSRN